MTTPHVFRFRCVDARRLLAAVAGMTVAMLLGSGVLLLVVPRALDAPSGIALIVLLVLAPGVAVAIAVRRWILRPERIELGADGFVSALHGAVPFDAIRRYSIHDDFRSGPVLGLHLADGRRLGYRQVLPDASYLEFCRTLIPRLDRHVYGGGASGTGPLRYNGSPLAGRGFLGLLLVATAIGLVALLIRPDVRAAVLACLVGVGWIARAGARRRAG
ncbi:hypothetical protein [Coralloluteibacterium stylophorae]|uniref:PH domain-containing protein n=1 Tax=Coralloluteibacterium stylophorae TaxID=1776034 RepID=A0A8J7VTE2_9GAMM|nr:hypothetical protein [Coralloluteibacterium stylophorae]MBS7458866.1 hypothetical protein [Coralloluteibacterium stylophorae]